MFPVIRYDLGMRLGLETIVLYTLYTCCNSPPTWPGYEATIVTHSALAVSRQPVAYVAWEPTKAEIELLRENPKRRKVEPGSTIGEDIRITNLKMSTTFSMRYPSLVPRLRGRRETSLSSCVAWVQG